MSPVSGIGFLGAGTIILRHEIVRGLTTAASLWTVAAVGLAVGGGLYVTAIASTVIILIILAGVKALECRFFRKPPTRQIVMVIDRRQVSLTTIEQALGEADLLMRNILIEQSETPNEERLSIRLAGARRSSVQSAVELLRGLPGLRTISQSNP